MSPCKLSGSYFLALDLKNKFSKTPNKINKNLNLESIFIIYVNFKKCPLGSYPKAARAQLKQSAVVPVYLFKLPKVFPLDSAVLSSSSVKKLGSYDIFGIDVGGGVSGIMKAISTNLIPFSSCNYCVIFVLSVCTESVNLLFVKFSEICKYALIVLLSFSRIN